jgi:hypothetical protein
MHVAKKVDITGQIVTDQTLAGGILDGHVEPTHHRHLGLLTSTFRFNSKTMSHFSQKGWREQDWRALFTNPRAVSSRGRRRLVGDVARGTGISETVVRSMLRLGTSRLVLIRH